MDVMSYKAVGVGTALTVGSTVTTLTTPRAANAILLQNIDASDDLIYTVDGVDPAAGTAFVLNHNAAATPDRGPICIPLPHGVQLKLKRAASADVTVVYQFVNLKTRF